MGASQVEYNMRGAGARCSQVGTFPTFSGILAETFHFGEFLRLRKFLLKGLSGGVSGRHVVGV